MLIKTIEKCRLVIHRYRGTDHTLRQELQEMVWHRKPIEIGKEDLTNLRVSIRNDDVKGLRFALESIASKYGIKVAMQTSMWDPDFCYPNDVNDDEVEIFGIIKEIDWFSFAVKTGSVNCIKWAVKNHWAHPGQMIEATNGTSDRVASNLWSGEKSTLRAICWSGYLKNFNWIESFKDNEAAWLKFNSGAYTNAKSSFLMKALEAVIAPNKVLLNAAANKSNRKELQVVLLGEKYAEKNELIALSLQGLRGRPGSSHKISAEAYRNFIDFGLCSERDVCELQHMLGGEKFKPHVAWIPGIIVEMEARLLAKDIGHMYGKLVKKGALAL